MSVLPIRPIPKLNDSSIGANRRARIIVGGCVLILLAFTTATVFVDQMWAIGTFEIGVFVVSAACLLSGIYKGEELISGGVAQWLVYLIPWWGVLQIIAHTTTSTADTREAVLRWGALSGVFLMTQVAASSREDAMNLLRAFLIFATAVAALCLTQLFNSNGLVLWRIPSGYRVVFATFQSRNNYAQFVELSLPIAVWRAMCKDKWSWLCALSAGILYASVVAVAARTATVLCTVELVVIFAITIAQQRNPKTRIPELRTFGMVAFVVVLAAVFTLAAGWQQIWERFQDKEAPFVTRWAYLEAAAEMTKQRPLTGFGLDTFTEVYPKLAVNDFPYSANHTHNDWAEFAAGGGVPFLLLVFIPFALAVPTAVRHPWGVGLVAVMIHACVDYPFPRPAVSGWMFMMLGTLLSIRKWEKNRAARNKPITSCSESPTSAA